MVERVQGDKKKVAEAIKEIVESMIRMDGEKDQVAGIKEVLKDKYEVDGSSAQRWANLLYWKLYKPEKYASEIEKAKMDITVLEDLFGA